MKLMPLGDKVVVRVVEADDVTPGGIVLPDNAKEKPQRGVVVAVGEGRLLDTGIRVPPAVEEGDEVLFGKYVGTDIEVGELEFKVLRESEILAKIVR